MNHKELATFARYYSPEDAEPLLELLKQENIPYQLEHERNQLDAVMIGGGFEQLYVVKIPANEFEHVKKLQSETTEHLPELMESETAKQHLSPERLSTAVIILGYILSGWAMMGIFVGLVIVQSKRRLPSGEKIMMFDAHSRMHGRIILFIALVRTTLWILPRLGWMQMLQSE